MGNATTANSDSRIWPRWLLLLALLGGNVALALGPWFVRLADTGPVSSGFWRLALALPFVLWLAQAQGERPLAVPRRGLVLLAVAGMAFALDLASWHVGIGLTRIGNATLFGNSGSLILMVWAFIALRRLPHAGETGAILMALAGAATLLGRSLEISPDTLLGDLFCLLAGLLYAIYLIVLQRQRGTLGSWTILFWSSLAGAPLLLALALALGEPVWPTNWGPLIALAVLGQLIGQGLLVFALRHFSAVVIGLALLTQPAIGALTGWLVFGETMTLLDVFGMALLGGALVLARAASPQTEKAD
ncbi:DMT family transporter [Altererythrobacter sp. H2]|uniref:DMT family transporter n=1 Tax=Altererythrobacter sp. H2 TaxID=3108391 RepID=UPI002B4BFEE0|nr:DMT family transporter [Altererythrobacter sp. H2]WRK95609.1 DMT family transporter [Altererythrobacter sp. H2]